MKKVLYGTTALIAAGLVGAGSAQAADPIKLGLGGYSFWYLSWQSQADSFKKFNSVTGSGGGQVDMTSFDVQGDTEVYFSGSTTLDNGLKVSVMSQLEAGGNQNTRSSSTDVIDEAFVTVEGGFGKLEVGTLNLATYRSQVSAPDYSGELQEGGLVSGRWVAYPGSSANQLNESPASSVTFQSTTAFLTTGDSEKINYYTPSFGGLTLMASYVPSANEDNRSVTDNTQSTGETYSVGAGFNRDFSGIGVKAVAGWLTSDQSTTDSRKEWTTGLQLSYAGFSVGGSYRRISEKFSNNTFTGSATQTDNTGATWNAGVGYEQGPWGVSADYMQSDTKGLYRTAGKDKMKTYQVGGKYTLSPGVDLMALAGYIKFDDESVKATPGDANHNDGWAVATAVKLKF